MASSETSPRIRVAILSGFPSVRAGLAVLLGADRDLEVSALDPVIHPVDSTEADVIVIDESGLDGATELLRTYWGTTPLVLIGAEPRAEWPSLGTSPVAFLSEDADSRELIAAVRAVASGLMVVDPEIAAASGLRWRGAAAIDPMGESLTPREIEVLRLVADGLPNKTIAHQLGISEHTVKFHVGSLLAKLDAASRTEAVTIATRRGLLAI
jgi:two-component system nitrate/nitrite response regulator NarL